MLLLSSPHRRGSSTCVPRPSGLYLWRLRSHTSGQLYDFAAPPPMPPHSPCWLDQRPRIPACHGPKRRDLHLPQEESCECEPAESLPPLPHPPGFHPRPRQNVHTPP